MDGETVAVGSLWPSLLLSSVGGKNSVHWEVPTFLNFAPQQGSPLTNFCPTVTSQLQWDTNLWRTVCVCVCGGYQ
jgi:hypothetical protein